MSAVADCSGVGQGRRIRNAKVVGPIPASGNLISGTYINPQLICLAENLREMEVRGFKTNFCPGTVTIFSPTLEEAEFFSVQEVISRSASS